LANLSKQSFGVQKSASPLGDVNLHVVNKQLRKFVQRLPQLAIAHLRCTLCPSDHVFVKAADDGEVATTSPLLNGYRLFEFFQNCQKFRRHKHSPEPFGFAG
jgi:hypothetical protein